MNFDLTYSLSFGGAIVIVLGISVLLILCAVGFQIVRAAKQDIEDHEPLSTDRQDIF